MDLAPLILKKNEERRLRQGHLWVFSNEVDVGRTPLSGFAPGQPVQVRAADGRVLGCGYVNPASLICARLVSHRADQPLESSLIVHRLKVALGLRERLFPEPFYRLIHGESDGLPGLVVDRMDDVVVVQLNTAGMEALGEAVVAALVKVLAPRAVVLRNDSAARTLEGLERRVEVAHGTLPASVRVEENGARFEVSPLEGQKTGWFYDHRLNRARMQQYVAGARVLDVFSYVGAWGVQAAVAGAEEVTCIEASGAALDRLAHNAALNGVDSRVNAIEGDAFDALKALRAEQARFDVVIVDPPAFIKRKKDLREGSGAYRRINQMAMQLLARDGILVTASCSFHMPRENFLSVLHQGARHLDRNLQILEQGHQGPDHPIHPAIPETDYLKCLIGRVTVR